MRYVHVGILVNPGDDRAISFYPVDVSFHSEHQEKMNCNLSGTLIPVSQTVPAKDIVAGMAGDLGPATKPARACAINPDSWYNLQISKRKCEWQDSNLRTPARIDLESITFGRSVTLAQYIILS